MPARESRHVEQIYRTARTALRCGCVAFCVWCVGAAAAPFAGRSTSLLLQASLSALADLGIVIQSEAALIRA
jgi:hypothetical protein